MSIPPPPLGAEAGSAAQRNSLEVSSFQGERTNDGFSPNDLSRQNQQPHKMNSSQAHPLPRSEKFGTEWLGVQVLSALSLSSVTLQFTLTFQLPFLDL